jgi:hypothetical protein
MSKGCSKAVKEKEGRKGKKAACALAARGLEGVESLSFKEINRGAGRDPH